jgi:hypothetical protein
MDGIGPRRIIIRKGNSLQLADDEANTCKKTLPTDLSNGMKIELLFSLIFDS